MPLQPLRPPDKIDDLLNRNLNPTEVRGKKKRLRVYLWKGYQ